MAGGRFANVVGLIKVVKVVLREVNYRPVDTATGANNVKRRLDGFCTRHLRPY